MQGTMRLFGTMPDETPVDLMTLRNGSLCCNVISYGGALQTLTVPDRNGQPIDILLGFDTLNDYRQQNKFMGALIGRYANRIGNARFALDGRDYCISKNDGPNHLHGGSTGFDKQVWKIDELAENYVTLSLFSQDGEAGYPGDLSVQVTYHLTSKELIISYKAWCNADTLCNLTNHAYFNLSGHDSGPITEQYIQIPARFYTPTDSQSIPTGEIVSVEDTPMDLRGGSMIGQKIDDDDPQIRFAGGYDHNWVLDGPGKELRLCARAWSKQTGIEMNVMTTLPGVQFYSGNYLDDCPKGKGGAPYAKRWGFCLETQYYPNSPNCAHFPSAVLRAGEIYQAKTVYRFSVNH